MSIIHLLKVTDDGSKSETSTLSLQLTLGHLRTSGFIFILINYLIFSPHCVPCSLLVPQPRAEPVFPAEEERSPNH